MRRRWFLKGAAAGVAVSAASSLPKPALSQGRMEWRLQTTWPKGFPGLGAAAGMLADFITRGSDGRLGVKVFGAGEIVPTYETLNAVNNGTLEMGHGAPFFWAGEVAAASFIASMPFGMSAQEQNAWFAFGGGQELADKVYREMGCKFFASGNIGVQMGGWFNKQMSSLEDYQGLKMRIPGLGGQVVKAAGGDVVKLSGAEISTALESGKVDASVWFGPFTDLAFGLHKSAAYYYYPAWHEPATVLDNFIGLSAWESLPGDLRALVEAANAAVNGLAATQFTARNTEALNTLVKEHGVKVKKFPNRLLNGLGELTGQVMDDLASADPLSRQVVDSILRFRRRAIILAKVSDQAFYNARALPFRFARPSRA
ncbi:MAG: TRAP transporter substrate-binding protein [Kiloniellales bacterium]